MRIRIEVKSWILIRIIIEMKSWIRIRTHIEVKGWIRIQITAMRIRNPELGIRLRFLLTLRYVEVILWRPLTILSCWVTYRMRWWLVWTRSASMWRTCCWRLYLPTFNPADLLCYCKMRWCLVWTRSASMWRTCCWRLYLPTFNPTDLLCYLQDEMVVGVDQVSFYVEDLLLEAVPTNL
jgi:hypothetical protein